MLPCRVPVSYRVTVKTLSNSRMSVNVTAMYETVSKRLIEKKISDALQSIKSRQVFNKKYEKYRYLMQYLMKDNYRDNS